MTFQCEVALLVSQRLHIAFGSMITSGLSIIGSIGTIILIIMTLRKGKLAKSISTQSLLDVSNSSPLISPSPSTTSLSNFNSVSSYSTIIPNNSNNSINNNSSDGSTKNLTMIFKSGDSLSNSLNPNQPFGQSFASTSNFLTNNTSLSSLAQYNSGNLAPTHKKNHSKLSYFVINLTIADLIASLFIFLSRVMMTQSNGHFIQNSSVSRALSLCTLANGLVAFSFLSTFMWTMCIAVHIYRQFNQSSYIKNRKKLYTRHITKIYYLCSWILPLALGVGIMFSSYIDDGNGMPFCQINEYTLLFLYYIPLITILISSTVIIFRVKARFQELNKHNLTSISSLQNKVIYRLNSFVLILFICWIVSIISFCIRLFGNGCQIYQIEFISNITSPLQGFFNFVAYLYSNSQFTFKAKLNNLFSSSSKSSNNSVSNSTSYFSFRSNE